jgi:hypothetical protein
VTNFKAKERVQNYLDTISKYLAPEIKGLASKRPNSDGYEGYAVPLALTLFALIDVLGFLLKKKTQKEINQNEKKREKTLRLYWLTATIFQRYTVRGKHGLSY